MSDVKTIEERATDLGWNLVLLIEGGEPLRPRERERLTKRISGAIATAIRDAVNQERGAIFAEYNQKTGDDLGFFVKRFPP